MRLFKQVNLEDDEFARLQSRIASQQQQKCKDERNHRAQMQMKLLVHELNELINQKECRTKKIVDGIISAAALAALAGLLACVILIIMAQIGQ